MKNKAFTLMELLGVIVILGILALVTFPNIASHIAKAKTEIKEGTNTLIIDAAKDYYEDNKNDYEQLEGITYCINISTLTDNNYLNKKLKNENLNDIDTTKNVKMIYHNNNFEYQVTDDCNSALTRNSIEIPIITEGSGLYKSEIDNSRLVYKGETPNNWIELNEGTEESPNNVKYRIVSFESDGTIKVIRNESIGERAWDQSEERYTDGTNDTYCSTLSGCNVWGNQTNTLYNGTSLGDNFHYSYYESPSTTTLISGVSGKVGNASNKEASLNEFLNNGSWTQLANLDKYIEEHKFNVGSVHYSKAYEAGDKGLIKEKMEEKLYTWTGKVGLLSITELTEASTNSECTSIYSNFYYSYPKYFYQGNGESEKTHHAPTDNNYPCKNSNWTFKSYSQWTITPYPYNTNSVWYINAKGYFSNYGALKEYNIRPAFYLKSDISLTGQGSETDPYIIQGEA